MIRIAFSHVTEWVFDLDNTLYPREARLFDQIEDRMRDYIMRTLKMTEAEAVRLRQTYWRDHGTTLAGLMTEHGVEPEGFLLDVHEIDLVALEPDADLRDRIAALPGHRIVYTNGSRRHAERVLAARGLSDAFDAVFGVEDADYHPKPKDLAFSKVFARAGITGANAAMFEDDARNLMVPHALGMRTVLVGPPEEAPHIHHQTDDLSDFLTQIG